MSLYLEYRPESFEEMLGNEEEIESLALMLAKPKHPHVFLFAGESGCGKTTAARIAAKIVGATGMGLKELNSSNNRGIETARDIIDQAKYLPAEGSTTVFIIDEVHKATNDFQNAMLKICEDTPDHVYIFFCTTEPKKLIAPLLKRCQVFTFKKIPADMLKRLVKMVAKKEQIVFNNEVFENIANKADGSARTALVILEKVMGIESETKAMKIINEYVDEEDAETIELCRALINNASWTIISGILKQLKGQDAESIRRALCGWMAAVLLNGTNDKAGLALEMFSEPFFDIGFPGVVLAAWQTFQG